jgi:hypothetical protein
MTGGVGSAQALAATPTTEKVSCTISSISFSQPGVVTTMVKAAGGCTVTNPKTHKKTAVPATWTHRLLGGSDQLGFSCNLPAGDTATGSGTSFKLSPAGAYTAKVMFGLTSKKAAGRPSKSVSKTATIAPHGTLWYCAKLGSDVQPLADLNQQCPWRDSQLESIGFTCSQPAAGACGLVKPPTMNGTTVSAGYAACPSGNCLPSFNGSLHTWFGSPIISVASYSCSGGTNFVVGAAILSMTNPAGQVCSSVGAESAPIAFTVPSSWGGELRVSFALSSKATVNGSNTGRKYYETGAFQLGGNADGCPQLPRALP